MGRPRRSVESAKGERVLRFERACAGCSAVYDSRSQRRRSQVEVEVEVAVEGVDIVYFMYLYLVGGGNEVRRRKETEEERRREEQRCESGCEGARIEISGSGRPE